MDFRAIDDTIQMLVYRINFANPAADRLFSACFVANSQNPPGTRCGVQATEHRRTAGYAGDSNADYPNVR